MNDEAFVDEDMEPDPRLNEITNKIIGCAIEVHRHLGPRYLEAYYKEAMAIEMNLRGVRFQRQKDFEVLYKGHVIGTGRLDFLVEDEVIVELKAVESLRRELRRIQSRKFRRHRLRLRSSATMPRRERRRSR